jgi:hypothetical protein
MSYDLFEEVKKIIKRKKNGTNKKNSMICEYCGEEKTEGLIHYCNYG